MLNKTELVEPTNQYKYKPDYADASEAEIEDYLDHFSAPLVGRVAYQERTKMRNDLRHQMEQVIVAYQELGSTRAEAVAEALQQFRQTAQTPVVEIELNQSQPQESKNNPTSDKSNLGLGLIAFGATALFGLYFLWNIIFAEYYISGKVAMLTIILSGQAPQFFAGAYLGYRNSNRILRTVLKAHLLLVLPVALLAFIPAAKIHGHTLDAVIMMTGLWIICSLPFGSFGAVTGKWLKKTNILDKLDPPTPVRNPQDRAL